MCPEANRLRLAWYATATKLGGPDRCKDGPSPAQWRVIEENSKSEAYQAALGAYRAHRQGCEKCREEMAK